jgi:hypothetical protein
MAEIYTTRGMMEESLLQKTEGHEENDNEIIDWQEYRFEGEIVKREVQMHLKQGIFSEAIASL